MCAVGELAIVYASQVIGCLDSDVQPLQAAPRERQLKGAGISGTTLGPRGRCSRLREEQMRELLTCTHPQKADPGGFIYACISHTSSTGPSTLQAFNKSNK